MVVETLPVGPFESNCYVVIGERRQALVIDPGDDARRIKELIGSKGLQVAAYLLTHGHMDHVNALAEVHRKYPAPVAMHPIDTRWAFTQVNVMLPWYDVPPEEVPVDRELVEGSTWTDAGLNYRIMETPGHTPGGVSIYFPGRNILFSGDALFMNSVGRTDLPGGNARQLAQSLTKLAQLPDGTMVYPGHGPSTTIGQEKRTNFFLRGTLPIPGAD